MSQTTRPWYRYSIMWLVVAPPTAAVLGGIVTMTMVLKHPDHDVRPRQAVTQVTKHASNSVVPPAE